jgi:uncharacterized RDD family membrane protein YckC
MNWFYAEAEQQKGPVNEDEFQRLIAAGTIQPTTLVWRDGMANWAPLSTVQPNVNPPPFAPPPLTESPLPPGQVVCGECRKTVPSEEAVQIGQHTVCVACKPTYVQKLREGAATFVTAPPAPLRFAGFWIRVAAYMIDQIIMTIVSVPFTIWFQIKAQKALQAGVQAGQFDWGTYLANLGISSAIGLGITLIYKVWFVGKFAATPGKMLLKLKVVTATGDRVSYWRALGRFGGEFVSGMACGIGYLLVIWDKEKRALHDMMCNTRVIYK